MASIQLITWNVNGLRAILRKNFYDFVKAYRPDVLCLQETRVDAQQCPHLDGFEHQFFNHSESKKGYSGTAILSTIAPINIRCLDADLEHPEGRILVAEFPQFFLVNTYVPNSQNLLQRLSYRVQVWDKALRTLACQLDKQKPVVLCGDFNVAHEPIDLANPNQNHFNAGFTDEERQSFSEHLAAGFVDVFRQQHPNVPKQYTWWSYRMRARERNIGWRIDYFLASQRLLPAITNCTLLTEVMGSDHAPVSLTLDLAKIQHG